VCGGYSCRPITGALLELGEDRHPIKVYDGTFFIDYSNVFNMDTEVRQYMQDEGFVALN
jgi:hypothetical protein